MRARNTVIYMKIDATTPRDKLEKVARRSRFWCNVLLACGIILLVINFFLSVLFIGASVWAAARAKKALDSMALQDAGFTAPWEAEIPGYVPFEKRVAEIEARHDAAIARIHKEHAEAAERWQQFLKENDVVREIPTKVAGVTFRNEDGTSRQKILADALPDDSVEFEYHTYKGAPAYAVLYNGDQIGNLPADLARDLYDLDDSYTFVGKISAITGGGDLSYGCNLLLTLYKEK